MKRSALSLIEVLISMFVLTIGLLSVASLVPVGQSEMVKGGIADRTSSMGQSAYHDVRIRGLLNPGTDAKPKYANANGAPIKDLPADTAVTPLVPWQLYLDGNSVVIATSQTEHKPAAIAIDPLFVATTVNNGTVNNFPYDAPAGDGMKRITLLQPDWTTPTPIEMAREVFWNKDDLVIDAPADEEAAALSGVPQQARGGSFGPPGDPFFDQGDTAADFKKRLYEPKYSWLFTLVPNGPGAMRMSIVIFRSRLLEKNAAASDPEGPINERTVDAVFFGDGRNGDTVTLTDADAVDLNFTRDSWVLLYGVDDPGTPADTTDDQYLYHWYKVLNASAVLDGAGKEVRAFPPDTAGPYTRDVSLQGADWSTAIWGQPKAAIFEGVVSVFEKTVQPEGDSAWSN